MGTSEGGCTGAVGEARRGQASERQVRGAACESGPCPPHSGTGSSSASASLGPGYSTECRWSEEEGSGLRAWLPSTTTRSCWTPATPSPARPFPQPQGASPPTHTHGAGAQVSGEETRKVIPWHRLLETKGRLLVTHLPS